MNRSLRRFNTVAMTLGVALTGCAGSGLASRQPSTPSAARAVAAPAAAPTPPAAPKATEIVIFGFEGGLEGWSIPDWAKASSENAGEACLASQDHAAQGQSALEIQTSFPGDRWASAYVEREVEMTDWTPFGQLSVDVYLPETAPMGLRGKIILTIGDQWEWTEMNRAIPLQPGAWTPITVSLKRYSMDWKFFPDDEFRKSVHKIGVRIESDSESAYRGPVFLDNVRLTEFL